MKILLLGEYSGLHKNLALGLRELGHDVQVMSEGDGWKNITSDIQLPSLSGLSYWNKLKAIFIYNKIFFTLPKYDVVHIINPRVFYTPYKIFTLFYLFFKHRKVFLSGAGEDTYYYKYGYNKLFRYWFYSDLDVLPSYKGIRKVWFNSIQQYIEKRIISFIPSGCEYKLAWEKYSKVKIADFIPMALHIDEKPLIGKTNNKIVFFHGLNRDDVKGTKFITKALKQLEQEYPKEVEVIIEGGLPLDEYLKVLNKADVVLDQCKSYGYGMNALYAMSLGKVVMSGAEPECIANMPVDTVPVINIKPDVAQIYDQLVKIVNKKAQLVTLKNDSFDYVNKYHNPIAVAQAYVKEFTK